MNTETIKTADDYRAWTKSLVSPDSWTAAQRDERKALFKGLPADERYKVQREDVEPYFTADKKSEKEPFEEVSPSGRYRLVVSSYGTQKGSWNYSRGEVFRVSDGVRVADVKRNYSSFWFTWLEDHPDGHDYLACGEDYQGQTFCQLDTGEYRSLIPDDAFEGYGFCWAHAELLPDGKTMKVEGCYWACPYEFRLYDVSSPMGGWPALDFKKEGDEDSIASFPYDSNNKLTFEDGLYVWVETEPVRKATGETEAEMDARHMTAHRAHYKAEESGVPEDEVARLLAAYEKMVEEDPDPEEDPEEWNFEPQERITCSREGNLLTVSEHWKSERKIEAERRWEESEAKAKARRQQFLDEDELYQHLDSIVPGLRSLTGFEYPSYNARHVKGDPNPVYLTIRGRAFDPDKSYNHSSSLKWGVADGPIQLAKWARGKGDLKPSPEFPRTKAGVLAAWRAGQAHLAAEAR